MEVLSMTTTQADASTEEEKVQIGPRLPKSLIERLWVIARRDGRTFNSVLEDAAAGYVERDGKAIPDDLLAIVEKYIKRQERKRQ